MRSKLTNLDTIGCDRRHSPVAMMDPAAHEAMTHAPQSAHRRTRNLQVWLLLVDVQEVVAAEQAVAASYPGAHRDGGPARFRMASGQ